MKILIVEDEPILAISLKLFLEQRGLNVIDIADKGKKAIDIAVDEKPDLILMDIFLQNHIDGIEVSHIILDKFLTNIIFITASTDQETLNRIKDVNHYAVVHKPYNFERVIALINEIGKLSSLN